jgi:8-amino-7-oxononanoate synthase
VASLPWSKALAATLAERQLSGRYRRLRARSGEQGVSVIIDGKEMLSFCSNDYLGLAAHPTITKAFINAAETEGVGSGAAHLLSGHSYYHQQLEEALADFMGQQSALLFSSGYQANLGVIDGLMSRGDVVIQDKLNHASLLDGGRLSAAKSWRYHHVDMGSLQRRLRQTEDSDCRLVVTDGVFSMDGDLAPLQPLIQLTQTHQAALMVDDAHAIGVLGKHGRGSVEHWQVKAEHMPIVMGTLGKAFGTAGAFVAADKDVIETLIQQSRTFVYTTAQPAAVAAASLASLILVRTENWRREKLQTLIEQFRKGAAELGIATMNSLTPIQPIMIGDDKKAIVIGQELESRGFLLGVIRTPTVPLGSARLRVTLSTNHTEQNIKQLLEALEDVICTSQ